MRNILRKRSWSLLWLALGALIVSVSPAQAQSGAGNAQQSRPADAQQSNPPQDPIAQLNVTPEQRVKIRAIREQNKEERTAISRRVRDAQIALDETLDSDNPSEELIERRAHELGEAQAALIRMRALTEIRIRRVLTPDQLSTLRQLRLEAQKARQEQRLENRANQSNRGGGVNGRALPNQRNGVRPLNQQQQRRNGLPRKPGP